MQVVADAEGGGEVSMSGYRLKRCYLPWVSLAVTQVPDMAHGFLCVLPVTRRSPCARHSVAL